MYSKEFPPIAESEAELEDRLKRVRDGRLRPRLRLLLLVRSGRVRTRREAARVLSVHRNSVASWLADYERDGLEALLRIRSGGPGREQKTLPEPVFSALAEKVAAEGVASYVGVQQWLRAQFGLEVPYRTVHGLVRDRLGVRLKRNGKSRG